jgi:hypothetical protein
MAKEPRLVNRNERRSLDSIRDAAYRENVLTGFRQVEDNLAAVMSFRTRDLLLEAFDWTSRNFSRPNYPVWPHPKNRGPSESVNAL